MNQKPFTKSFVLTLTALGALLAFSLGVHAAPYASSVTGTNGAGVVSFTMNEAGANVVITFEDLTTTNYGVLPRGLTNFYLGAHTSFTISCFKEGTGSPAVISVDTDTYAGWPTQNGIRGVAVNKNPKVGVNFGRLCVGYATNNLALPRPFGLYLLNSDLSYVKGPVGPSFWSAAGSGNGNGPWRIRANADGTFLVNDFSTPNACLFQFSPDLSTSNLVFSIIGQTAAVAAGQHGDFFGCGIMKGSLAAGNLELYTFDSGMGTPPDTNCIKGPLTSPGSYNCVFKYNIGSGPLPWNKRPDFAYTMGLDGIAELRTEGDVGPDGKVYCAFGRANSSNPNLQILRPVQTTNGITGAPINGDIQKAAQDQTNWLYTGGANYLGAPFNVPPSGGAANDPWAGNRGSGVNNGSYAGVRISPDGKAIACVDFNNGITIANLTNGIPDDSTIYGISQAAVGSTVGLNTSIARGMDWDPAGNIWVAGAGMNLLRCWALGQTTTCFTGNDWTGTNGTFSVITPPSTASLTMSSTASQNYTNNTVNPGAPIAGTCTIGFFNGGILATPGPTMVGFVRGGTAVYGTNYVMNTNETPGGVIIDTNYVIFPAGIPAGGFVAVSVKIIPTATPLSGPTLTFTMRLISGTNYNTLSPFSGTMNILNTGPQLVFLTGASPSTLGGMNRGIPGDQARFLFTRYGDLNGPGNDALSVVPKSFTITNVLDFAPAAGANFKANRPLDYTAGPQNFTGALPVNGSPGIVFAPNVAAITAMIGNPVKHVNTSLPRTNLQVVINLTNTVAIGSPASTTNVLSSEGYEYKVRTGSLALDEFDNAIGGEVILWSNPLTNSFDSTNWTLVYATINQDNSPMLPTVKSNYDNSANIDGLDYYAVFGKSVNDAGNDGGVTVPQSDTMAANGWTSALKVTVNKNASYLGESGINLYPQIPGTTYNGSNYMVFRGNYALRFDMFLSLYDFGIGVPTIGSSAAEFAAFGINHFGTNANWRLSSNPRLDGTGARPINADGEWCVIGASSGVFTPADYDLFVSPPWIMPIFNEFGINTNQQAIPFTTNVFVGTNSTVLASITSQPLLVAYTNAVQSSPGVYTGVTNIFNNGGVPNDQVSQNNLAIAGAPPIIGSAPQNGIIKNPPFVGINNFGGAPANGWVDVSLELTRQTNLTLKVAQQQIFKSSILTPAQGSANPIAPYTGTPMLGYIDPNLNVSDYSAFVYFSNIRVVELSPFIPWTNQPVAGLIVTQGSTFSLSSGADFASNPLTNIWYLSRTNGPFPINNRENGTPLVSVVTNVFASTNGIATLTVNNVQAGTNYVSVWRDTAGSVTNYISRIEVIAGPGDKTALLGSTTNFTVVPSGNVPPTSYQWRSNGVNLVNGAHYAGVTTASLFITNVTAADAGVYSCLVTNADGSVVAAGTLNVQFGFEAYEFSSVADLSTSAVLSFTTADPADTLSSFALQAAGLVTGPYTNYPYGVFSGANPDFMVTIPKTNTMMYFRLKHN